MKKKTINLDGCYNVKFEFVYNTHQELFEMGLLIGNVYGEQCWDISIDEGKK